MGQDQGLGVKIRIKTRLWEVNTRVETRVKVMAMVSKTPMLAVPGWPDSEILANDPMVVRALNTTARGVEVAIAPAPADFSRMTRWMALAIPSPNNNGSTITLAKLNGRSASTETAMVRLAATNKGAKINRISLGLLVMAMISRAMAINAQSAA